MVNLGGDLKTAKKPRNILRQPKIFQAMTSENKTGWSKFNLIIILVFLGAILIVYAIFFSSWFQIKNIEIIGSPSTNIRNELDRLKGKNLFSFNSVYLEESLMNNDRNYSSVQIYRGIPDTIRVVFANREPKLIWQTGDKKYFVDENAILFEAADNSVTLPLVIDLSNLAVKIPEQITTADFIKFVQSVNTELAKQNLKITNYEVGETTFQITAVTDQNLRIIFNTLRPVSEQIDAFQKVYGPNKTDIKEYIDLRVEGKVYYK